MVPACELWGTALTGMIGRFGLIGMLAAALMLAGCGRKGSLEAPPSASIGPSEPAAAQPTLGEPEHRALEGERRPAGPPPQGPKKSFFLDFLIN